MTDTNLGVKKGEKEIHSNFKLQYASKIIKIQVFYRAQ